MNPNIICTFSSCAIYVDRFHTLRVQVLTIFFDDGVVNSFPVNRIDWFNLFLKFRLKALYHTPLSFDLKCTLRPTSLLFYLLVRCERCENRDHQSFVIEFCHFRSNCNGFLLNCKTCGLFTALSNTGFSFEISVIFNDCMPANCK